MNRSGATRRIYDTAAEQFSEWLAGHGCATELGEIGKREMEDFMGHMAGGELGVDLGQR